MTRPEEITTALDSTVPYKSSLIQDCPVPLSLKPNTLRANKERDLEAKPGGDRHKYRLLGNKVMRLLKRNKLDSNQELLLKSRMYPKKVWSLANSTLKGDDWLPSLLPRWGIRRCGAGSACQPVLC